MKTEARLDGEELLELLRSTDVKDQNRAFEYLYMNNYEVIKMLVLKNNGLLDDTKDVFQDTLIALHRNARNPEFELSCQMSTYLYSIARNIWFNKLKSSNQTDSLEDVQTEFIETTENRQELIERAENNKMLAKMIDQLKEDCRKVLKLFYFERFSMNGIADEMGYANQQVAKNKKSSCLKHLKKQVLTNPNFQR